MPKVKRHINENIEFTTRGKIFRLSQWCLPVSAIMLYVNVKYGAPDFLIIASFLVLFVSGYIRWSFAFTEFSNYGDDWFYESPRIRKIPKEKDDSVVHIDITVTTVGKEEATDKTGKGDA